MLAAVTQLQNAQTVKEFLLKRNLIHQEYLVVKEMGFIYFPITKSAKVPKAKIVNTKFQFPRKAGSLTIEELLKTKLLPQELAIIPKSQEIVGQIMILEIPEELISKEKIIAQSYLQINKNIDTVVKKDHIHTGEYRLRKVKILAGKNSKETIHQESGIKIKLHLERTYFSARTSHERLRIAKQVKPGENIMVMFSGAGPLPLILAHKTPARHITGIEINPLAHQYALQSIELNNLQDKITLLEGDVRERLPQLNQIFDRIAMPLPKTGEEFLDVALPKLKKKGILHLYAFLAENEIATHGKKVKEICTQLKHPVRIMRAVKCGQFSPRVFRICFDLKMLK